MPKMLPLTALSGRSVLRTPVQLGPDYPEVLHDREIGGPRDPSDRRLVLSVAELEQLLEHARASLTQRAVLHHVGLRVRTLQGSDGHRWDHVTLIGSRIEPEPAPIPGGRR